MRIVSGDYLARAHLPVRRPRYAVTIEFGAADLEVFTSHAGITDIPAGAIDGVVKDHSAVSQSVDPETGASTIGSLTVRLGDIGGVLTDLFQTRHAAGEGLRDKTLRFYKGFDGLSFDDFQLQWTQIIYDVAQPGGEYTIACNDLQRQLRADIFPLKKTALAATLSAAETSSMTVDDTSEFEMVAHGTSYSHGPSATWGYVKIDDEVIGYTGKTATTFTGLDRGLFGTSAVEHEVDAADPPERRPEVEEYVYLELPVPKLALALMTGELYDQGGATLPGHWHESIDSSLIDVTQFEEIGDDLWVPSNDSRGLKAYFTGIVQTDGKRFIETELFLLAQIFSPVLADGRLGLKRFTPALASAPGVAVLGTDNVASHGALRYAYRELYNRVLLNWSWVTGEFRRQTLLIDADSIATHGQAPIKVFSFRGLASNSATHSVLQQRFDAIRDRYSSPPLHLPVDASRSMDQLEVGDIVRVQLPNVRDMMAESSNAIDRSFEIRQISQSRSGPIKLMLVGSSAKATPQAPDVDALPDTYYDDQGVDLSTVVDITAGVTDAGTFSVPGNADLGSAVYYFLGDLTISSTTTLEIDENVQLRIRGHLTLNGSITGVGEGLAGVADDASRDAGPGGQSGFFGITAGGDGATTEIIDISIDTFRTIPPDTPITGGKVYSLPLLNLKVDGDTLEGVPSDLRGTSGGPGGKLINLIGTVQEVGGTGGPGGAGLLIVSRGLSFGGAAVIDLSGGDGSSGTMGSLNAGHDFFPGGGAGGAPGALYVLLDGDQLAPDLSDVFIANSGETPQDGTPLPQRLMPIRLFTIEPGTGYSQPGQHYSQVDWSAAAGRVQFVTVPETPVEDLPSGTDGKDGTLVEFIFQREALRPATPTGDGVPSGWSDEPISGSDPLWVSTAKQELDGTTIGSWSTPIRMDASAGSSAMNVGRRMNSLDQWFNNSDQSSGLASLWSIESVAGPVWATVLRGVDNSDTSRNIFTERMTIDPTKRHRVSIWARQPSGDRNNYLLVAFYNDAGVNISSGSSDATGWGGIGSYHYWQIVNANFASDFTLYSFEFGGGAIPTIPTGAVAIAIGVLGLRTGTTETTIELQDYYVIEIAEPGDDGLNGDPGENGENAVNGFIEPSNGLAWTRAVNAGAWSPSGLTTDLDCTFVQGGVAVARIARRLTLTEADGTIAASSTTHVDGNLNTARVTVTVSGGGTTAITVQFAYSSGGDECTVAETAKSVQGGSDGTGIVNLGVHYQDSQVGTLPQSAGIIFTTDGLIQAYNNGSPVTIGKWWSNAPETGIGDSYRVRNEDTLAGAWDFSAAAEGTWVTISSDQTWRVIRTTMEGTGTDVADSNFQIRGVGTTSIEAEAIGSADAGD